MSSTRLAAARAAAARLSRERRGENSRRRHRVAPVADRLLRLDVAVVHAPRREGREGLLVDARVEVVAVGRG